MSRRHEQLLFRYSSALERGEFEAVADVLREAERDPVLEQAILEMNEFYAAERLNGGNHLNGTNPKEVPMTLALYQRRSSSPVQWHSLPLVAALAVIAILTVILAAQIRSNALWNMGNGDQSPALAQVSGICEATLREAADAHSRPGDANVSVGTIPAGSGVKVLDQELAADAKGESWALWFFVVAEGAGGVQGWIPAAALNASDCPQANVVQATTASDTPTPANLVVTMQPFPTFTVVPSSNSSLPTFTVVPSSVDAGQAVPTFTLVPSSDQSSQALSTFTPTAATIDPAAVSMTATAAQFYMTNPCKATTRTTADVMAEPSWGGEVLKSVLRNAPVTVGNFAVSVDAQGRQDQWYYVSVDGVEGWMLASLLDASDCPPLPNVASVDAAQMPTFSIAPVQPADVQPGVVQPITIEPITITAQPATIAPEVHVVTLPPPVVSGDTAYSYNFTGCTVNTEHTIEVFAAPSPEAHVVETVPSGTTVQIVASTTLNGGWYFITYSAALGGYVAADTLVLPTSGCATPEFTVSAAPVVTPLEVQTTIVPGTFSAQATPQYYIYVVQPGDTLVSILARFHLDMSAMPDVLRANNLTEDSVIAPGITLYVPTSQQLISLACVISAAQMLDLLVRPSADALVIGTLPAGAKFELTDRKQQPDGVWYAISAQMEGVTVQGAWVRPGSFVVPSDCQQSIPGGVITLSPAELPSPVVQPTPTIIP